MSDPPTSPTARGAVFLSYASQDTAAARRICDALRAAGQPPGWPRGMPRAQRTLRRAARRRCPCPEKRLTTTPNHASLLYHRTTLLACLGEKTSAEDALRTLDQLVGFKNAPDAAMSPGQLLIHMRLGHTDEVMAHLPASLAQSGTSGLWPAQLRLDPRFDALRNDPRFEKLLAQYPLPGGTRVTLAR